MPFVLAGWLRDKGLRWRGFEANSSVQPNRLKLLSLLVRHYMSRMEWDDQIRRFFGTEDLAAISPAAMTNGIEMMQVELGLEKDTAQRFAIWAILYMFDAAPDLDAVFEDEADRNAARSFMELMDRAAAMPSKGFSAEDLVKSMRDGGAT